MKFALSSALWSLFAQVVIMIAIPPATHGGRGGVLAQASDSDGVLLTTPLDDSDGIGGYIIGGEDAVKGEFPFYAHADDPNLGVCGGVVIAKNIILTAGHCDGTFDGLEPWILGSTDDIFTTIDTVYQQRINAKSFAIHPDYLETSNPFRLNYDFAIIELAAEFTNANVGILAPAGKKYVESDTEAYTIMGRGVVDDNTFPSKMQKADVQNAEIDACVVTFGGSVDADLHVCAGGGGEGSCGGDSGGPLVSKQDNVVVGITSFGVTTAPSNTCPATSPSVYARVSVGWDWINQQVCDKATTIPDWADCDGGKGSLVSCTDPNMTRWGQFLCLMINSFGQD